MKAHKTSIQSADEQEVLISGYHLSHGENAMAKLS